jgi:isoleucyl-tRNA synthetase
MDRVREVCSAGHAVRKAHVPVLRTRLPLAAATVAGEGVEGLEPFRSLIADELNVREVRLTGAVSEAGDLVLTVNPRVAGPRLGAQVQQVIRAAKAGRWERAGQAVVVGGVALEPGEFELRLLPKDETTSRALPNDDVIVVLDVRLTPDLEAVGLARDVVRLVQEARKGAGLDVRDRIHLRLTVPSSARPAIEANAGMIAHEVLALQIDVEAGSPPPGPSDGGGRTMAELAGHGLVAISVNRVDPV